MFPLIKDVRLREMASPLGEEQPKENDALKVHESTKLSEVSLSELKDMILVDDQGQPVGWISKEAFIKQLLDAYQMHHAFFQAFLASADDAVTIVDKDGIVKGWSKRSEDMYGLPYEEVVDQPINTFFDSNALMVISTIQQEMKVEKKYNQPKHDIHVLINSMPVYRNGALIGGISVERDISDLVKLNNELATTTAYLHDLESNVIQQNNLAPFQKIKGRSDALQRAVRLAKKVATTDASVLITGESGVGKELFAEGIHLASQRADKPFIAINCGAIPAALFESELFGYEPGAFTGAVKGGKKGKVDAAKGGTLFLDEIGELPLELQVKLLRVLQEKMFYRVGGTEAIPIDLRIVAATNRQLEEMVEKGEFREDLFYRINVISIPIPPLRERPEDIPELIQLFLKEFSLKYAKAIPTIDPEVIYTLLKYKWPGNIRQLRNLIERLVILSGDEHDVIKLHHLPEALQGKNGKVETLNVENEIPAAQPEKADEVAQIKAALTRTYGNKSAAAKLLGISRATLYNKMKRYELE
ncbi:sigma-54 interaction domain-containing protein [Halalkalibacterium halodurans]|uniref:sigma-54 interaction domain-containing protein n=1 Tax=Halalkalibacterium halodurans TaxID=86665 RepID=UPI002E1EA443